MKISTIGTYFFLHVIDFFKRKTEEIFTYNSSGLYGGGLSKGLDDMVSGHLIFKMSNVL